jgi:hypothetical protein
MAEISDTELVATQQDLISSIVQDTLKQNAKLIPTVTDYSSFAPAGAKSVSIPRRDTFTAEQKAENTTLTKQEMTFSADQINLDKKKAILASVELISELQSNVNVNAEIIMEQAKELALQVDNDIVTELKLASAAAPDHRVQFANTPTDTIQQSDILEARRLLCNVNVPMDDQLFMGIHCDQEKSLLSIADFVRADSYGSPEGLRMGMIGRVYNFNVVVSTAFDAGELVFWHKSAVGYASQQAPSFMQDDDLDNIARKLLLYHVYGTKVLSGGVRQVLFNATGA